MWLYEVHEGPRPGLRVSLSSAHVGVQLGFDDEYATPAVLPLGRSLTRLLVHKDDEQSPFMLMRANLEETTAGLCLTKQSEEEARAEKKALVLIDGRTVAGGVTHIGHARGKPAPELVTYTQGDGCRRELYVFKPGDALFISWAHEGSRPKKFVIEWNGQDLVEQAVARRWERHHQKRRGRQQEASPQQPRVTT